MLGPALATFALTRIPKTDNVRMKTRNGLSSLISESLNDFALRPMSVQIHRRETETSGGVQIKGNSCFVPRQLLCGSLVPYRASIVALHLH
jgi:hypothetical protein